MWVPGRPKGKERKIKTEMRISFLLSLELLQVPRVAILTLDGGVSVEIEFQVLE